LFIENFEIENILQRMQFIHCCTDVLHWNFVMISITETAVRREINNGEIDLMQQGEAVMHK
jgi:hypothetical protein